MPDMKIPFTRLLLVLALLGLLAPPARADIEIITLRYRNVEQIIPLLQPLVDPGGALTGMQNQLVIRASANNIADLRRVLATIDSMPRQLKISVRQGAEAAASDRAGSLSGRVGVSSGGGASTRLDARITDSNSASDSRVTQTLQVLEGNVAVIQAGTSQPVPNRIVTRTPGGGVVVTDTTAYRDVTTGFSVLPRVSGERVTLEINPQRDTINANAGPGGSVNVQRASSVVSGRLGEWIELGGMSQIETRSGSGLLSSSSANRSDNRSIWVKVEELR